MLLSVLDCSGKVPAAIVTGGRDDLSVHLTLSSDKDVTPFAGYGVVVYKSLIGVSVPLAIVHVPQLVSPLAVLSVPQLFGAGMRFFTL